MSLPNQIDPTTPLAGDLVSLGDDQIRALKQAIVDILGMPAATNISNKIAEIDGTGLKRVAFQSRSSGSGLNAGELAYESPNSWYMGDGTENRRLPFILRPALYGPGIAGPGNISLVSLTLPGSTLLIGTLLRVTVTLVGIVIGTGTLFTTIDTSIDGVSLTASAPPAITAVTNGKGAVFTYYHTLLNNTTIISLMTLSYHDDAVVEYMLTRDQVVTVGNVTSNRTIGVNIVQQGTGSQTTWATVMLEILQ